MRVNLEVLSGPLDGHIFQFNGTSDIGREGKLKLSIDRFVSRRHAVVEIQGANIYLEDLASTNGTFVDDERVNGRVQLNNGKVFRVGRTWLQISW
ncbi:MAG: FHA domain-containing protein [Vulcanimicrobiota bacterium]